MRSRTGFFLAITCVVVMAGCNGWNFPGRAETDPLSAAITEVPTNFDDGTPGRLLITPDNTQITFRGKAGPMRQSGSFQQFSGRMDLDGTDLSKAKLEVQIEMESVKTRIGLLTRHLKSKDFFEVETFPTASFVTTSIESTDSPDHYLLNGRMNIHGVTRSVQIPARIQVRPEEVLMDMQWVVRQSEFGMEKGALRAKDEVPLTVTASIPRPRSY